MAGFLEGTKNFFLGTPEKRGINPEAQSVYSQLLDASQRGKGGAFGQAGDYYSGLMSDDSADYNAFAAPAIRQFNEDIMPGISEQFAGLGAGGLSSSGFRNAQVQGGVDLSERLGALRAQLRQQGAQGLMNLGQLGLKDYSQTLSPGTTGLLPALGETASKAAVAFAGGLGGGTTSWGGGNWFGNKSGANVGANTSGYQANNIPASPQIQSTGKHNLPTFMNRVINYAI